MKKYHEPIKSIYRLAFKERLFLIREIHRKSHSEEKIQKYKKRLELLNGNLKFNNYPGDIFPLKGKKVAVYTCIFGNYDTVKPVECKSKYCDYFIITDQTVDIKSGWKKLDFELPENLKDATPVMKNRYFKMHPHILFPDYDYSIYIDGSMKIYADIFPLLGRLGDKTIGMFSHVLRDCIYDEADVCVRMGKITKELADLQMSEYRKEGYPEHYGLTDNIVIVRKHNDKNCRAVMEKWWDVFLKYPYRDQLGFGYALWKCGFGFEDVAVLGKNNADEVRLAFTKHK